MTWASHTASLSTGSGRRRSSGMARRMRSSARPGSFCASRGAAAMSSGAPRPKPSARLGSRSSRALRGRPPSSKSCRWVRPSANATNGSEVSSARRACRAAARSPSYRSARAAESGSRSASGMTGRPAAVAAKAPTRRAKPPSAWPTARKAPAASPLASSDASGSGASEDSGVFASSSAIGALQP